MTFKPFEGGASAKPVVSGCRVSLTRAGRATRATLQITLAGRIRDAMALHGTARIAVLMGEGEHHGLIRIRVAREGDEAALTVAPTKSVHKTEFYRLRLGAVEQYRSEPAKAEAVNWEQLDDGWIEIALPAWADETRPKPKERVSAVPPAMLKAKAAGEADAEREKRERKEAEERRKARELFGDKLGDKVAGPAGGA